MAGAARNRKQKHGAAHKEWLETEVTKVTDKQSTLSNENGATPNKLERKKSWRVKVNERVIAKRRYSLLAGILLGITAVAVANIYAPPLEDVIQLPTDTVGAPPSCCLLIQLMPYGFLQYRFRS